MLRSNLSISILLSFAAALSACSIPKPQEAAEQSNATYFADKSEVSVTSAVLNSKISLPVAKNYNFRVCVKDLKLQKAIINHEFHVSGENSDLEDKKLTSDANGCVFWSEKISYNHLADARFVEIRRSLSATGLHHGNRTIPFAINPWEDLGYSLLDKEIKNFVPADQAKAALQGLSDGKASKKTAIWFDDLRLTIDEKQINKNGLVLNFEIRALPSFSWIKSSGQKVLEALTYGEFEGELSLIHVVSENQKEVRRFLQAPIAIKGSMSNNSLLLETKMTLDRICTRGQVQLGLKLKAMNAPENISGFEGVFIVGECDQIKGNTFSRLKTVFQEGGGALTIQEYLGAGTQASTGASDSVGTRNSGDLQTQTDTSQQDSYQMGQVEIKKLRFENVSFDNKSSFYRKKTFNVQACMKTGLDQKSLRAQVFKVIKLNGEPESIRSNDDGCISWDDSIEFNYLDQECWSQKNVQITNTNLGVDQSLKINVNPWTGGDSSLRDIRFLNAGGQKLTCAEGKSEIVITGFSFDKREFNYDINPLLQLKIKKTGLLRLNPTLKRPSLTDPSGFEQMPLPVGPYVLKFAVADNFLKDFNKSSRKIYQTGEKLVFVNAGGTISELVTLESWNIKAMGNTNQLLLEIFPAKLNAAQLLKENPKLEISSLVEDKNQLTVQAFTAPLVMSNNSEGASATLLDDSALLPKQKSLVDYLKIQLAFDLNTLQQEDQALGRKKVLAENENLEIINVNNEQETVAIRKSLQNPTWWKDNASPQFKATPPAEMYKLKQPLYEALNEDIASRLCAYWFFDRLGRPVKSVQVPYLPQTGKPGTVNVSALPTHLPSAFQLTTECLRQIRKDPTAWFDVQYRYFLTNVTKVEELNPQIRDFSIQTSFSMSRGHSDAITKSRTWDVGVSASFAPKIGFFGASIGGGFKAARTESSTDSDAYGTSASFSSGISGTVERLSFKLHSENVEKCVVLKLKPKLYADLKTSTIASMMDSRLTPAEKFKVLSAGIMICQGQAQMKSMNFVETYFVLNQKMSMPQVADPNSEASRPFFAAIRGERDFNAFMGYLHATMGHPSSATGDYQAQQAHDDQMTNAFLMGVRAYPGQYLSPQ